MNYVIGDAIRKKIVEKGITFSAFADKFGITPRNLQHVFKKTDLPISQIVRASEILDHDFLYDFIKARNPKYQVLDDESMVLNEPQSVYQKMPADYTTMLFSLTIAGNDLQFSKFPELLIKTRRNAEELGFKLL